MKWYVLMFLVGYLVILGGSVGASPGLTLQSPEINPLKINNGFMFNVWVFNSSDGLSKIDSDTSCIISLYNLSGTTLLKSDMTYNSVSSGFEFQTNEFNFTVPGRYSYTSYCNTTGNLGGFLSKSFDATPTGQPLDNINGSFLWFGVLLPLIFSLLLLIGAITLSEDHQVMKIFMFLLSFIPLFASMWIFSETLWDVYYGFTNVQDALGDLTFWFIWLFIIIIFYFIIYFIKWAIDIAAQSKQEKLEY